MPLVDSFLRVVVDQRASDLHLHAGKPPIVRLDGDLVALPFRALTTRDAHRFVTEVLDDGQRATFKRDQQVDFIHVIEGVGRFRANAFVQHDGVSAVFRAIADRLPSIDELHLPESVRALTRLPNGLVLVTGPTGSGKTTTLAAMLHEMNMTSERHIITLEDPVEFVHEPLASIVTQRQVGHDVASFSEGLRSALRESPDVLMVGELRDYESVSLALHAAETGVLVIATLHTRSAAKAIDRVIDVMPEESRDQARGVLSVMLRGVVAQALCKRASGSGRVAALEILLHNYAVANLIRENKVHQVESYLRTASNEGGGMQSLDQALFRYVRDGIVARDEALRVARSPELLAEQIGGLPVEE